MKYDIVENNIKIGNKIIYGIDKDILDIIHSLEKENQELKEQVEEYKQEKQEWINLLDMFKNQQKEFIEYLESEIDRLEKTEFYIDSIQKAAIETHKHNLSKYQEIIGQQDGQQSGQV